MGVAESLCLGTEKGGPTVLLSYSRFGPSKTGFLRLQALSVETGKVTFVPGIELQLGSLRHAAAQDPCASCVFLGGSVPVDGILSLWYQCRERKVRKKEMCPGVLCIECILPVLEEGGQPGPVSLLCV